MTPEQLVDLISERANAETRARLPFGDLTGAHDRAFRALFDDLLAQGERELLARHIGDQYIFGFGAEQEIEALLHAFREREEWQAIDRFAAGLLATREPALRRRRREAGTYNRAVEEARATYVSHLREAAAWLRDAADTGEADRLERAACNPITSHPAFATWQGFEAVDQQTLYELAGVVADRATGVAGFDTIEASKRDWERARARLKDGASEGDAAISHADAYDRAYDAALIAFWQEGRREHVLMFVARLLAEMRSDPETLAAHRAAVLAHARQTGDRAAWRLIWTASISGSARQLATALSERDAVPEQRMAICLRLYDARIEAANAMGLPAKASRLEEDRALLASFKERPLPPPDKRPVDDALFWQLIAEARKEAQSTAEAVEVLRRRLTAFAPRGIKQFHRELGLRLAESYRWDLWALASAWRGGCGDDAFDDFRCWLIMQGRDTFYRILADPERAWREFALTEDPQAEDLLHAAADALQARRADPNALPRVKRPKEPAGTPFDENRLDERFPRRSRAR